MEIKDNFFSNSHDGLSQRWNLEDCIYVHVKIIGELGRSGKFVNHSIQHIIAENLILKNNNKSES